MRSHSFTAALVLGVALLGGCGGGGASSPAPALLALGVASPQPVAGLDGASGPVTLFNGGATIGSTVSAGSAGAIFTIDSGTAPKTLPAGASLATFAVVVTEVAQTAAAPGLRTLHPPALPRARRNSDLRIPDPPNSARMTAQLLDLQRRSSALLRRPAAASRSRSFAPGDGRTFVLQGGTINGSGGAAAPIAMRATLVAQSSHANVWLDDAAYRDPAVMRLEYPSGASDFATVAAEFEQIFAIETQAFGPAYTTGIVNFQACDAAGAPLAVSPARPDTTGASDPHLNIVITDRLRDLGEGGYFFGLDLLDADEANCVAGQPKPAVNGLPMIVVEGDAYAAYNGGATETYPANNEAYWLRADMPQTIAHEFQHYLHFVNKYLQQHVANPDNPNAGTLDDAYIDEGCSVLAQDLVAQNSPVSRQSPAFVRAFLLEPNNFSLTAFTGYAPNALDSTSANPPYGFYRNTAGNYGYAYLFVRYLYDRFGPGALKAIYAEQNFGAARQPDTGPASAAAGGEPFGQLFREFTAALAVHSGGAVPPMSSDPAYAFSAGVILRGATQTYSRRLPPYQIRNIVQPGPLNPQTFAHDIPTGYVRLAAGDALNLTLIDGAALFISPELGPAHTAVSLRASVPLAGGGSLGQGPLPVPSPAYF